MGIEYRLNLVGDLPAEAVAERVMPEPADRPVGGPTLLEADLYDTHGFVLSVLPRKRALISALSDGGQWERALAENVMVSFDMDKFDDFAHTERAIAAMLTAVGRVLDSGPEDAVLTLNGDVLLLSRFDGITAKHSRVAWWEYHAAVGDIIPG